MDAPNMDVPDPHATGLGPYIAVGGTFTWIGTVAGYITPLFGFAGAMLVFVYYGLSVWEMQTVQTWIKTRRARRTARQVAKLEVQQSNIVGELKKLGVLTHAGTSVSQGETVSTTTTIETATAPVQK